MIKKYRIEDIDCANCAAKIEKGIQKIEGVINAELSFMAQKLTIEAEDVDFPRVIKEALKVAKKVEPDCSIEEI